MGGRGCHYCRLDISCRVVFDSKGFADSGLQSRGFDSALVFSARVPALVI